MQKNNNNLAAILIKVTLGSEKEVKEWLIKKSLPSLEKRHCIKSGNIDQQCRLCPNVELTKAPKERSDPYKNIILPCEKMDAIVVSYLLGPFDFLFLANLPDTEIIENFIVECLRSGEISKYIVDTQTLTGLVYFSK